MAYVIYKLTTRDGICDTGRKEKLEKFSNLFVGAMMCLGGTLMLLLAFVSEKEDKGIERLKDKK